MRRVSPVDLTRDFGPHTAFGPGNTLASDLTLDPLNPINETLPPASTALLSHSDYQITRFAKHQLRYLHREERHSGSCQLSLGKVRTHLGIQLGYTRLRKAPWLASAANLAVGRTW